MQLDLEDNPVSKIPDYRNEIYKALPKLHVLDGHDKDNNSVYSEEDYGEEGENEIDEGFNNLDPEMREKIMNGEVDAEELRKMGVIDGSSDEFEEEGEYE